ncbi:MULTISPECIES: hypothetical protein [unclassified Pseudomonas]|uniref:hypothetical protein n=1 Tax=unclassified Pseudomonas TaxID=196821 RepID=UPI000D3318F0|nr:MULTISPECIES: hypothetical protein [unclassified Pseudomonas]RAU43683.1 hypothetical protein DBP26_019335 [Pseudomonas sp. RIT 409]RAU54385.1 hypothetical protein DBY65_008635 [Pseudomonas sp. RIT 412]
MNRSVFEIAATGVDDLLAVQKSFDNSKVIFELIMKQISPDSTVYALVELGMLDVCQWESKVMDWCVVMDDELDCFTGLREAYQVKSFLRNSLRTGGAL